MAERFNPPNVWAPFGAFSMGVAQGNGKIIHLKGQVALPPDGDIVGQGKLAVQVRTVLSNIQTVLAYVGGEMGDIISLTQYVTDIEVFMAREVGDVRDAFFVAPYPVTTTVAVSRLYDKDLLVEIMAIAEIQQDRFIISES